MCSEKKQYINICCNIDKDIMKVFFLSLLILSLGSLSGVKAQEASPDSLFNLGHDYYRQAKYDLAADHFQRSADLFLQRGDSLNWADAIRRQGDTMMNRGQVREALDLFLFLDNNLPENTSSPFKISFNRDLGRIYRELEQYDKAKEYYLKGIEFAEASGDSSQIAILNNNISYPYLYSGDYQQAIAYQQKAIEMYESLGDEYSLSFVLNGIFLTLRDLNLHEQANTYIRKSKDLVEQFDNPDRLDIAYHNMALSYNDLGKRDSAIIFYHKSLELSRMLENPFDITQTLINIGLLYERSNDFDNALAYYNEALETNYQTERPVSIAKNLMRLADVATKNNDLGNAETFYTEALNWMEQAESPQTLADLYLDFSQLEIKKHNYKNAKSYLDEAFSISNEKDFKDQQVRVHTIRGQLFEAQGETDKSLQAFRNAYELANERTLPNRIFPAIDLAKAYHKASSDSSFIIADKAFSMIDEIRTNVAGLTFRSGYFSQYAGFYNEVASWHILKGNDEKAYDLVESAKARVLMDELAEAENNFIQQLDESTMIKKQQLSKQIDQLYNRIYESDNENDIQEMKNKLKDLEFEHQSFVNEIRQNIPEWKNFEYPEPLTSNDVMAMVPENSAIIEFAYTDQQLMIFLITPKKIHSKIISEVDGQAPKEYFTENISSFRDAITEQLPVSSLNEMSYPLYNLLVEQILNTSDEQIENLVVVPEGNLTFLPFEALNTGNNYLIQDINLKYLPSASIYPFIQAPHRSTQFDLLALAGSGFTDGTVASESSSQNNFASLPSTLLEVEAIGKSFGNAKILKNDDVTEAGLKSHDLSQFRFLHFATHGNIDEVNPSQSGLILSKKADVESLFGEDGYLNSSEISALTLNADLVTLSACNTGMGKIITGEGLIGLQRSFLTAGSSAVMVSLWNIYDRSTADFMAEFYSQLKIHEANDYGVLNRTLDWFGFYEHPMFDYKAKALQDAKLAMIDHPYYNHPVHWAPFILIGK